MKPAILVFLLVCLLVLSACAVEEPVSVSTETEITIDITNPEPIWVYDATACLTQAPTGNFVVEDGESLWGIVEEKTGKTPSSTNVCYSITIRRGTQTFMITKGWAMLNNPLFDQLYSPWVNDVIIFGDITNFPEDALIFQGGVARLYQGTIILETKDWSSVTGGDFIYTVYFERNREEGGDWIGYCNGETFSDLQAALACGRGE